MLKGISAYKPNGHRAHPVGVLVSNDFLHLVGFRPTHLSNNNLFKTLNLSNTHSISEGSVTMFLREGGWGRIKGYGCPRERQN